MPVVTEEHREALVALLSADTEQGLRSALNNHRQLLLTEETERLLIGLVEQFGNTEDERFEAQRTLAMVALIRSARELGIDGAFAELHARAARRDAVLRLLAAGSTNDVTAIFAEEAENLLSEDALAWLRSLIEEESIPERAYLLRHRLALLERAQREGPDQALRWESHADLLRSAMNTKTPDDAEALVAQHLDMFASNTMGDVAEVLMADVETGVRRKFQSIRWMIVEALRERSEEGGYLTPRWLHVTSDMERAAEALESASSVEDIEKLLESDPRLIGPLSGLAKRLRAHPAPPTPPKPPSRPSYREFLNAITEGVDGSTSVEKLIDDAVGMFGPSREGYKFEYDYWLVLLEPWLADLDLPPTYRELARTLEADRFAIMDEIARIRRQLAQRDPSTDVLTWSGLHRQLAFLHLVLPAEHRAGRFAIAARHCEAAASILTKVQFPVAWANTHALYGEVLLATLGKGISGAVERKLRSIEPTTAGRIEMAMWELNATRDGANRAAGRFELALQVHQRSGNVDAFAGALAGLATALSLRWQGDRIRTESEARATFERALRTLDLTSDHTARMVRARWGYCAQYLRDVPAATAHAEIRCAMVTGSPSTNAVRQLGALEHLALRAFDAGDWSATVEAVKTTLDTRHGVAGHSNEASVPLQSSFLLGLAAYSLVRLGRHVEAFTYLERSLRGETLQESPIDPARLIGGIPPGATVVMPLVTGQGTVAFVLGRDRTEIAEADVVVLDDLNDVFLSELLVSRREDDGRIAQGWLHALGEWRERPTDPDRLVTMCATWTRVLSKIARQLVDPVVARLPATTRTIVIIPHRGLGVLPLHAAKNLADPFARCLIERYPVAYVASLSELGGRHQTHPTESVLTVRPAVVPLLKFAERECSAIAKYFPVSDRLDGADASCTAVLSRLGSQTCVHFACHGEANWDSIEDSALALSDGQLTVRDLKRRSDLRAVRLVTLSACETGVTDLRGFSNAARGMAATLHEAGAGCVVSALWPVSDAAAYLTMKKFYEGHARDHLEPVEALARAQRWLRLLTEEEAIAELGVAPETIGCEEGKPFSAPYYWAAFSLTGL